MITANVKFALNFGQFIETLMYILVGLWKCKMKKVKVAMIEVGRLGCEHASNITNRIPNTELVAICDAKKDRCSVQTIFPPK